MRILSSQAVYAATEKYRELSWTCGLTGLAIQEPVSLNVDLVLADGTTPAGTTGIC